MTKLISSDYDVHREHNPRMRMIRRKRGLTQRELAEAAGVGLRTIWGIENGITKGGHLVRFKIAEYLREPVERVFPNPRA